MDGYITVTDKYRMIKCYINIEKIEAIYDNMIVLDNYTVSCVETLDEIREKLLCTVPSAKNIRKIN